MNSPPLDGRRRKASLAPIYAALLLLVGLGLVGFVVASWPSGASDRLPWPELRLPAPAERPAGNRADVPSRPAMPKRGGIWTQSGPVQGFASRL